MIIKYKGAIFMKPIDQSSRFQKRNLLAANLMAILTMFMVLFGLRSSVFNSFIWIVFVPFVLIEWFLLKCHPVFHINRSFLAGMTVLYGGMILATVLAGNWHGFHQLFWYILCTAPFFMVVYLCENFQTEKGITIGLFLGFALLIIVGFWKWNFAWETPMLSIYKYHTLFGMALELLLPFGAAFTYDVHSLCKKCLFGLLTGLGIFCLFLSDCRGALMGLGAGVVLTSMTVVFLSRHRLTRKQIGLSLLAALLIACLAAGGILYSNHSRLEQHGYNGGGERVLMLEASYHMWQDHKLAGVGIKQWQKNYYGPYRPEGQREQRLTMPHNMIAYFMSVTGLIGTAGYLISRLLFLKGLCEGYKKTKNKALSLTGLLIFWSFFIHGFVDGTLVNEEETRLYYALMAIALLQETNTKGKDVC